MMTVLLVMTAIVRGLDSLYVAHQPVVLCLREIHTEEQVVLPALSEDVLSGEVVFSVC